MLNKRIFRINFISPAKSKNLDFDIREDKEISYEGKKITIKM